MRSFQRGAIDPESAGTKEDARRAGGRARGEREDLGLVDPQGLREPARAAARDEAGVLDEQDPVDGTRVRLHQTLVVDDRRVSRDRGGLGGSGDVYDDLRTQRARADGRGVLVAGADDDLTCCREPEQLGRLGPQRPDDLVGRPGRRERRDVQPGVAHELVVPGSAVHVVEERREALAWSCTTSPVSQPLRCPPTGASQRAALKCSGSSSRSHIAFGPLCEESGFRPVRPVSVSRRRRRPPARRSGAGSPVQPDDGGREGRSALAVAV